MCVSESRCAWAGDFSVEMFRISFKSRFFVVSSTVKSGAINSRKFIIPNRFFAKRSKAAVERHNLFCLRWEFRIIPNPWAKRIMMTIIANSWRPSFTQQYFTLNAQYSFVYRFAWRLNNGDRNSSCRSARLTHPIIRHNQIRIIPNSLQVALCAKGDKP